MNVENLVKFNSSDELVIACAIFAKFVTNSEEEKQANDIIEKLNLDEQLLKRMFMQVRDLIDDPIKMDAFYLEMRLVNDPNTGNHAEDFNLMVNNMIDQTKIKGPTPGDGRKPVVSPSFDTNILGIPQHGFIGN